MFTRQQGFSLTQGLVYLFVVIVAVTAAFNLVPAYSQNYTVQNILNSLSNNKGLQQQILTADPTDSITSVVQNELTSNGIQGIKADQISVTTISGGNRVTIAYDVTEPLFGNISLLIHFTDFADITLPQ